MHNIEKDVMGIKKYFKSLLLKKYFDRDLYCYLNPDVAESGIDPFSHFINCGWSEGRIACEKSLVSRLSRIPQGNYAILGATDFSSLLLSKIKQIGLNKPKYILDDSFLNTSFKGVPVKKIDDLPAGNLPVVIGVRENIESARDSFIRKTRGYTEFIDLFLPDVSNDTKVFCIGYGKTGTTSVEVALKELGYTLGNQVDAELLLFDWAKNDYSRIIKYCKTANAFQDIPFCCDNTYKELDKAFPNSKFILTVRVSSDQWFDSLCRYHTKCFSKDKSRTPTIEDLKAAKYRYEGYVYDSWLAFWNGSLYNKEKFTSKYKKHNKDVIKHFSNHKNKLLVLNVSEEDAYNKLCKFIGKKQIRENFPWENKT